MKKLAKILVFCALGCVSVAIVIKASTIGKVIPGPMPLNWAKLADTVLLFAIAISLLDKK